jgi:two-component sensor histidine kinase
VNAPTPFDSVSLPRDFITIATQLPQRTQRPDLRAEAAASAKLSRMLVSNPPAARPGVLEIARDLCHAGSAGLSVLQLERADVMTVRWELVRGALASYEGIDATRTNSPCGLSLDAGTTILVSRPARTFAWLEGTHPPIVETLIVPLQDDTGGAYGTLWIAHHESDARCTSDDARILEQLAQQLMLAMRLQEHARDREHAFAAMKSLQVAQHALLARDVNNERIRRMRAEAAARKAARALVLKEAMIDEVNHRTKNSLQAASALLAMQANATASVEARRALLDSHARLQLLSQVHALLCGEPNNTQSVFMPRLLQAVCDALAGSFGQTCPGVQLNVSCDPISLPTDDATAIALVANEAITNSYKHAFANPSSGEISVQLYCSSDRAMVLRISDTGTVADILQNEHGMGLKLMRLLSAQVQGALNVTSPAANGGTQITLTLDRATACERAPDAIVRPTPAAGTAA